MKKLKDIAILLLILSGVFFLTMGGIFFMQTREAVVSSEAGAQPLIDEAQKTLTAINAPCPKLAKVDPPCGLITRLSIVANTMNATFGKLNTDLDKAGTVEDGATQTLYNVNRPCGTVGGTLAPCGTLADVNKLMNTGRGTLGQLEIAANHEDRNLTTLDNQENTLFTDFHATLGTADAGLTRFNFLMNDPSILQTEQNVAAISGTGAHMLFTFDQVETKATQNYLHPSPNPFKRTWQTVSPFMLPVAQIGAAVATLAAK
jgi:hypothetical protein